MSAVSFPPPLPRFRISNDPFKILRRGGRKGPKWNFRFSAAKPTDEIETLEGRFVRLDGQLRILHKLREIWELTRNSVNGIAYKKKDEKTYFTSLFNLRESQENKNILYGRY